MSHGHVHAPPELSEPRQPTSERLERRLELAAVLLLALTTVATAWSGYQAARWSGDQSQNYARGSAARIEANQQTTAAGQLRIDDLLNFNGWLEAQNAGDRRLAAIYRARFRPVFVPAFDAWRADPSAAPSPLYMPEYKLPETARAAALDREANARSQAGADAKTYDDRYILSTVFFAAVLFFAGISLRLDWRPLRIAVLCMAAALLLGGLVFVVSLPTA